MPSSVTERELVIGSDPQNMPGLSNFSSVTPIAKVTKSNHPRPSEAVVDQKNQEDKTTRPLSPTEIFPSPKGRRAKNIGKRAKLSAIMISTPFKNSLEKNANKRPRRGRHIRFKFTSTSQNELESECDDEEVGAAWIYCNSLCSASRHREKWIRCQSCQIWAHTDCAGVDARTHIYNC